MAVVEEEEDTTVAAEEVDTVVGEDTNLFHW